MNFLPIFILLFVLHMNSYIALVHFRVGLIIDNGGGMDWNAGIHQRSMFARAEIFASCAKFISG